MTQTAVQAERENTVALTLNCPICGPRDAYEFRFGGEDKGPRPDDRTLTPATWCDYVHMNRSVAGVQAEWWCHQAGCGTWFKAHRHTVLNREIEKPSKKETE
jgi:sarcosine oxidase, subunit delta